MRVTADRRERPIIFSAESVRAILDGRKTQTRRLVKLPPAPMHLGQWEPTTYGGEGTYLDRFCMVPNPEPERVALWHTRTGACVSYPLGPGDRLWVKEVWAHDGPDLATVRSRYEDALEGGISYGPYYRATETAPDTLHWRSPNHMPRWASRLTLEITDVRVQRLQEISEEDAVAEGVGAVFVDTREFPIRNPRPLFALLWDEINGKRAPWESNPWVWALTFRRADREDACS